MTRPRETDFEQTIGTWLVEHGGYHGPVKVGNAPADAPDHERDFDPVAAPEGEWQPFSRPAALRPWYPKPEP